MLRPEHLSKEQAIYWIDNILKGQPPSHVVDIIMDILNIQMENENFRNQIKDIIGLK